MQPDHPVHDGNIARCVDKHPWCRARMWEAKGRRVKNGTAWQVEQCLSWMIGRWNMACWFRVDSGNVEVKVKHIQTLWGLQLNRKYSKVMFFLRRWSSMYVHIEDLWSSIIIIFPQKPWRKTESIPRWRITHRRTSASSLEPWVGTPGPCLGIGRNFVSAGEFQMVKTKLFWKWIH